MGTRSFHIYFLLAQTEGERKSFFGNVQGGQHCEIRERRQLGSVTLNSNLVVSGWVGLAYGR